MNALPIVELEVAGTPYKFFLDARLEEYREIHTPHISFTMDDMEEFMDSPDGRQVEIELCICEGIAAGYFNE